MQQLCITLMAVFGMIVPVMNRKLERILQTPRVLKVSQRLLLAISVVARPAALGAASTATERESHPDFLPTLSHAARRYYLNVATAASWRGADVDKPCGWRESPHGEQTGARLAGLLCVWGRKSACN